ncbi:MerR family transcriptional regulator [Metabacillus arenae]|uniref:MerR family transcriptional regulator n=1 Tax=Metabacillus arenae TaxID=2771434 RepID=A0A926RZ27_9BACI|nr:MerR family transcriptional regulator [Metabacillus arenae]MBD1381797.1 MerR family transcriptional regulator [Metabacillus arenae]
MNNTELFSTIQEASRRSGLTTHTLRYYEKIGLLHEIQRDKRGKRFYSEEDMRWIIFLLRLRETGMSIQQMLRYSDLRREGESTVIERRKILEEHQVLVRAKIAALQENSEVLKEKIELYKKLESGLS